MDQKGFSFNPASSDKRQGFAIDFLFCFSGQKWTCLVYGLLTDFSQDMKYESGCIYIS